MANRPSPEYCFCPERHIDINNLILQDFAREVIKEMCINPDGVEMPKPFGKVKIVGLSEGRVSLDYKATKEHGKKIYHANEGTDGYSFKAIVRFKRLAFRMCFLFKLAPYKGIKNGIFTTVKGGLWKHWDQYTSITKAQ